MADFAPELRDRDPQDYMKSSRGWDDNTAEVAIKGASDIFRLGVKVTDDAYKRDITEEARIAVDKDRDLAIAELHSLSRPTSQGGTPIPEEITRDAQKLAIMKQAVKQGAYMESNYVGSLDATARKLRTRYPGYRDHIDDTMKQLTGMDPANALVRELRQDAQAILGAKDPTETKRLEILKAMKNPPVGAENMSYEKLLPYYLQTKREDYALEHKQAVIATQTAADKYDTKVIGEDAATSWGKHAQTITSKAHPLVGATLAQLEEMTARFNTDDPNAIRDPKKIAEGMQLLNRATVELEGQFNSFMRQPRKHLADKSYAMVLGDEKLKEIKANQVDTIVGLYRTALVDGSSAHFKHAAQLNEVSRDTELQRLMGDPVLRTAYGLSKAFGPAGLDIIMSKDAKVLNAYQQSIKGYMLTTMSDPKMPQTSLTEEVQKTLTKDSSVGPEVIQSTIDKGMKLMASPDAVDAPRKAKLIDSFYGPRNEAFIGMVNGDPKFGGKATDPQRTFSMMANPEMAKAVHKFSQESGDPSHWEKYQNWVIKQTYAMNLTNINTVAVSMRNAPALDIKFNPQTFKFVYQDKELPPIPPSQSAGLAALRVAANAYDRSGTAGIKAAIDRVNASFEPIRDIVTLRKEEDPAAFALAVMRQLALQTESKYGSETASQGLVTALGRVLYDRSPKLKENITPGPYKAPQSQGPTGEAYDMTPVALSEGWKRLQELGNWVGSKLPTRESVDKARNEANRRGELR